MFYVYVMQSKKDLELYIGSTKDLRSRFVKHNEGKVFSTKSRTPFDLIYYEAYRSEEDARRRENNLKLRANALNQLKRRMHNSLKLIKCGGK
jgi:putative endonuclease